MLEELQLILRIVVNAGHSRCKLKQIKQIKTICLHLTPERMTFILNQPITNAGGAVRKEEHSPLWVGMQTGATTMEKYGVIKKL